MKRIIEEEINDSPVAGMINDSGPPADSIDAEIDARIVRYESESLKSDEEQEADALLESLNNLTLRFLLEEEEAAEASPDTGAPAAEKPPEAEPKLPLDVGVFASKIARLVNNAVDLLPIQQVIVARAMNYLRDNYDQNYADQLEDILNNQYDFNLSGDTDIVDVPIAAGAGVKSAGG